MCWKYHKMDPVNLRTLPICRPLFKQNVKSESKTICDVHRNRFDLQWYVCGSLSMRHEWFVVSGHSTMNQQLVGVVPQWHSGIFTILWLSSPTQSPTTHSDSVTMSPPSPVFLFCLWAPAIQMKRLNQDVVGPCAVLIKPDTLFLYPHVPSGCPFWSVYYDFIKGGESIHLYLNMRQAVSGLLKWLRNIC